MKSTHHLQGDRQSSNQQAKAKRLRDCRRCAPKSVRRTSLCAATLPLAWLSLRSSPPRARVGTLFPAGLGPTRTCPIKPSN